MNVTYLYGDRELVLSSITIVMLFGNLIHFVA